MIKRLLYFLGFLFLLAGVGFLLYPHASKVVFQIKSDKQIQQFEVGTHYQELYDAFSQYNTALATGGQSQLIDEHSYSSFPIDPVNYGVSKEMIGYIDIPSQDIRMGLYLGASKENIERGAGIMGYTSAPIGGPNTNTVIASHNVWNGALRFKNINKLSPGDLVYITNFWETLTYEVIESRIIEPDDVASIYIRPEEDLVTLMTCDNYGADGPDRCVVFCKRIYK